jgi:hypothetical protein
MDWWPFQGSVLHGRKKKKKKLCLFLYRQLLVAF